ncbi:MAG: NrdH-redoxin [Deltaproteobacteria bacterium]|nr:NrdH-redoxin [Deltaproteobacteria bacterium]
MPWLVLAALAGPAACSEKKSDDGTSPELVEKLPAIELGDKTPNLLLTWIDEQGGTHTEVSLAAVPEAGRKHVRVVVTDRPEGQGQALYVADLSAKRPDGTYPVATMARSKWESLIAERRAAYLAKHAPPPRPPPPGSAGAGPPPEGTAAAVAGLVAIIYGAPWCQPCHMAAAHLRKRGVVVIEKNIESDPAARAEMERKLERAGKRGAAIPIVDVGGAIIVGYSAAALDQAIARARGGIQL